MILYDFHHINKDCIVEVLYGDARSFNVTKEYTVVGMRYEEVGPFSPCKAYATVDVYGKLEEYRVEELRLLTKPGYTKISNGNWKPDYML
jgi:hypothetical protein